MTAVTTGETPPYLYHWVAYGPDGYFNNFGWATADDNSFFIPKVMENGSILDQNQYGRQAEVMDAAGDVVVLPLWHPTLS